MVLLVAFKRENFTCAGYLPISSVHNNMCVFMHQDRPLNVTLPLEKLLLLLLNSSNSYQVSGLIFWSTLLNQGSSAVASVKWQRSESKGLCLSEDVEMFGGLSHNELRLLYIYVQQCLVQVC